MPGTIGDSASGVGIRDLMDSREFLLRPKKKADPARTERAFERLRNCLPDNPTKMLDELVEVAVESCGADSAGISMEEQAENGDLQFRWVAVAGSFARYMNGTTPRFYSPCGTCLDRGAAQHYQVFNPYYNFLGVDADPILDGLLIPWRSPGKQGTLWLVSHRSTRVFDSGDYDFMRELRNYVVIALEELERGGSSPL